MFEGLKPNKSPKSVADAVFYCSPIMQRQLTYCMEHPEEISKMVSVQRKVGQQGAQLRLRYYSTASVGCEAQLVRADADATLCL